MSRKKHSLKSSVLTSNNLILQNFPDDSSSLIQKCNKSLSIMQDDKDLIRKAKIHCITSILILLFSHLSLEDIQLVIKLAYNDMFHNINEVTFTPKHQNLILDMNSKDLVGFLKKSKLFNPFFETIREAGPGFFYLDNQKVIQEFLDMLNQNKDKFIDIQKQE